MFAVHQRFGVKGSVALLCAIAWIAFAIVGSPQPAFAVFGAYIVVFAGTRPNVLSSVASRMGDLSYGIYLFGWPIEQLVRQLVPTASPWSMMAIALPIVLCLAAISHHLVERPALVLKKPFATWVDAMLMRYPWNVPFVRNAASLTLVAVTAAILLSDRQGWYVTPTIAQIALWSTGAAILASGAVIAARYLRVRRLSSNYTVVGGSDVGAPSTQHCEAASFLPPPRSGRLR
jgi:hypothetical protein